MYNHTRFIYHNPASFRVKKKKEKIADVWYTVADKAQLLKFYWKHIDVFCTEMQLFSLKYTSKKLNDF